MPELAQIGVTDDNLICLDRMKTYGLIDELQEGARLAASIALRRKLYAGKNLMTIGSKLNTRWNTSLVDPDTFFRSIIKTMDLCPEDAGIGLRSLIILGLDFIYTKIKDTDIILIGDIFNEDKNWWTFGE